MLNMIEMRYCRGRDSFVLFFLLQTAEADADSVEEQQVEWQMEQEIGPPRGWRKRFSALQQNILLSCSTTRWRTQWHIQNIMDLIIFTFQGPLAFVMTSMSLSHRQGLKYSDAMPDLWPLTMIKRKKNHIHKKKKTTCQVSPSKYYCPTVG